MTARKFLLRRLRPAMCSMTVFVSLMGCSGPGLTTVPIAGSGTGGTTTGPTLAPFALGAAADVYVIQNSTTANAAGSVLEFATGGSTNATPVSTLTTNLNITAVATDNYGSIYVAGETGAGVDQIEVFAANASGAAAATRTITIPSGYPPTAMATDPSGALITADGNGTLNVYGSGASGAAVPIRSLYGSLTGIAYPFAVTTDFSGNVYVSVPAVGSSPAAILVFAQTASGNVAPTRTITTGVPGTNFYGVAADATGNLYAVVQTVASTYTSVIEQFGPTATGTATPLKTIAGANTLLALAGGLRVDASGNLYLLNVTGPSTARVYSVEQFSSTATGNVAPAFVTTSTSFPSGGFQIALR